MFSVARAARRPTVRSRPPLRRLVAGFRLGRAALALHLSALALFFLLAPLGHARPVPVSLQSDYQADNWSLEEGFPENSCSGIVLAPDGYLWMGTYRGLVRFNGIDFRPWAPAEAPHLRTASIINLHTDAAGRTWFSTADGLVVHHRGTWRTLADAEGWSGRSDYVRSYTSLPGGDTVIGRFSGAVLRFDGTRFSPLPTPPGSGGTLVGADAGGTLYTVRSGFAGTLDGGVWENLADQAPLIGARALGVGSTREGTAVLVCRDELLFLRDRRVERRLPLSAPPATFWQLTEDPSGHLWLPAVEAGVFRISRDGTVRNYTRSDGLTHSGGTRTVFPTLDGSIWIGSGVGGLSRFRPIRFRYLGDLEGLGDREVLTLAPLADGGVAFTPYGAGLRVFDGTRITAPVTLGDEDMRFRSVLESRDGTLWLGAFARGLRRVDAGRAVVDSGAPFAPGESASTLFEDSRQRLWVGGDTTVLVRDAGRFRSVELPDAAASRPPTLFAERDDGTVLLGRENHVYAYTGDRLDPRPIIRLADGIRISSLLADRQGRLWIGTLSHGLILVERGRISRFTPERGLPGPSVGALIQDDAGELWFGCGRRIVRANPLNLVAAAHDHAAELGLLVFDRDDGMRDLDLPFGTQPTSGRDRRGRLWFALIRGAAFVDPAALQLNTVPPRVAVESLSFVPPGQRAAQQLQLAADAAPVLPAGSRLIKIGFAALDFSAPGKQRFRVMLEESGEWQDLGAENTITFLELPAGEHRVRIQASGADGAWNRAGTMLRFSIAPRYWQTAWFRGFGIAGFVAFVFGSAWFAASRRSRRLQATLAQARALAEVRSRLALVLENTSDFVAFVDRSDRLTFVNRAGRALVGLPAGETDADLPLSTVLAGPALREFTEVARPSALGRDIWSGESVLRHRDGREIPVSQVLLVRHTADGEVDFTAMIARDISAAKHHGLVQDALRRLAQSLTAVIEAPALGRAVAASCRALFRHDAFFLILIGPRGEVTFNAYAEDTAAGETQPHPFTGDITELSPQVQPVLRGLPLLVNRDDPGAGADSPTLVSWGELARRSQSLMYAPIVWDQRVIGLVSTQSYTPRRYGHADLQLLQTVADHCGAAISRLAAEISLRSNEERLRLAMQAARMGSWEIDPRTGRLTASSEAVAVYGAAPGDLDGDFDRLLLHVPPDESAHLRAQLDAFVAGRRPSVHFVHRRVLPAAGERWFEVQGRTQRTADEAGVTRLIGVTADITSRRLAELERERLGEQLRQAQKLEAVGTLAGGIAHDFNNILTAILGNTELAAFDAASGASVDGYLRKIRQSSHRARDLVRRILAFSRPADARPQLVAPQAVVDEVEKLLRATIPAEVGIDVVTTGSVPPVLVDATALHQVLLNLGTNAWHALEHRPGRITFALDTWELAADAAPPHAGLVPGAYVRIAVSDTGRGIPGDVLPRIFDPFFTTKAPGEGSGLGLSVVHGIMHNCGGAVAVRSQVGAGTTFTLYFPAAAAGTATRPASAHPFAPPAPAARHAAGRRILFIDDEEPLVTVAKVMLERMGCQVEGRSDPAAALADLAARPDAFDLLITDLSMPGMSGLTVIRTARALRPDLPIILTSGNARSADAQAARAAGVAEIIEKPATPQDLLPVIERLLHRREPIG